MSARKLSESEKKEILNLYRETSETSSSLATRYGVSTSTISRLLKSTLPADEYESLIQQKRAIRITGVIREAEESDAKGEETSATKAQLDLDLALAIAEKMLEESTSGKPNSKKPTPKKAVASGPSKVSKTPKASRSPKSSKPVVLPPSRSKKPTIVQAPVQAMDDELESDFDAENNAAVDVRDASVQALGEAVVEIKNQEAAEVLKEILSDSLLEPEDEEEEDDLAEVDDLSEDDELDDELDGEEFDEDGVEAGTLSTSDLLVRSALKRGIVQILPLADAPIPRTCYLVVDRSAELIAPPLKEFGDLGGIPQTETQAKTLPVFDNHRVAKRYSNPRTQRVIKLPDGRVLPKASPHLQAKGITRVLIDGQVYSL